MDVRDARPRFDAAGAWLPVALGLGSLLAAAWMMARPAESGPVAAVFPPWWSGTRSVLAAASAGAVVRAGAFPFVVVVAPDVSGPAERLRRSGAWLILDPRALGGCAGTPIPDRRPT